MRIHGHLLGATAATLAHWFGRMLKAYVEFTGGRYCSRDMTPFSVVLQVKFRCVAVPWSEAEASKVEAYIGSRLPGSVCGGGPGLGPTCGSDLSPGGWLILRTLLESSAWKVGSGSVRMFSTRSFWFGFYGFQKMHLVRRMRLLQGMHGLAQFFEKVPISKPSEPIGYSSEPKKKGHRALSRAPCNLT